MLPDQQKVHHARDRYGAALGSEGQRPDGQHGRAAPAGVPLFLKRQPQITVLKNPNPKKPLINPASPISTASPFARLTMAPWSSQSSGIRQRWTPMTERFIIALKAWKFTSFG
jgi:hypothetical protein